MIIEVNAEKFEVSQHPVFSFYATSKDGKVFSLPAIKNRVGIKRAGYYQRESYWVEISQFIVQPKHTPPYRKCRVTQEGMTKLVYVHRFMLQCWRGIEPRSIVVRHLDGDSLNNTLGNLKYGTVKENVEDAFRHTGNYAEGAKNGRAKLTESDVIAIRKRYESGERVQQIWQEYTHVSNVSVANAAKRKTWPHIK